MISRVKNLKFRDWHCTKSSVRTALIRSRLALAVTIAATAISANAGPVNGVITDGAGEIFQDNYGQRTTVVQDSHGLTINWDDFSSEVGESIRFFQPDRKSFAINLVTGGVPSNLRGDLEANGRIYILNESGVIFHKTSTTDVGALVATTATGFSEEDGELKFTGTGYGRVINHGSIRVAASGSGFAVLAAPYVKNTGIVKANLGDIYLSSNNGFFLDIRGDGLVGFNLLSDHSNGIIEDGEIIGVDNSGSLIARSGMVAITAGTASEMVKSVINLEGVIDVSSFDDDISHLGDHAIPGDESGGFASVINYNGDINTSGALINASGGLHGVGGTIIMHSSGNSIIRDSLLTASSGDVSGFGGSVAITSEGLNIIDSSVVDITNDDGLGSFMTREKDGPTLIRGFNFVHLLFDHRVLTDTGEINDYYDYIGNVIDEGGPENYPNHQYIDDDGLEYYPDPQYIDDDGLEYYPDPQRIDDDGLEYYPDPQRIDDDGLEYYPDPQRIDDDGLEYDR